jgi:hypothetical protein
MKSKRDSLVRVWALAAVMGGIASGPVSAFDSNAYLNGTYIVWGGVDQYVLTFDGAGNYTGTLTANEGMSGICTLPASGTYTVGADGTVNLVYTRGCTTTATAQTATGSLSFDGNSFLISDLTNGQETQELVGIKLGQAASENNASGLLTLSANTTGSGNSASGYSALASNTSGINNTAAGTFALLNNTTGPNNTAFGFSALNSNTSGKGNAAQGANALFNNTTGLRNLGIGSNALYNNVSGSYNIALGFDAGYGITTGNNNIEIGSSGSASDNGTIQIGLQGTQTLTMIAGISGTPVTGSAVYVTTNGQLGVQASSERYKTNIATMPELSAKLGQLRPVTFQYNFDPKGMVQYGLVAEEVDRVYPELVIRDDAGKIQGLHYEELTPILLRQVQSQESRLEEQQATIQSQNVRMADMAQQLAELNDLTREMRAALDRLKAEGEVRLER